MAASGLCGTLGGVSTAAASLPVFLVLASDEALSEASRSFALFAVFMGLMFLALIVATVVRRAVRSREVSARPWSVEDLFDPVDVEDMTLRLALVEAATRANLDRETVEELLDLAAASSQVVAVRSEPIWVQNGGRKNMTTIVFQNASAFRVLTDADVELLEMDPSYAPRLVSLELTPAGRIAMIFKSKAGTASMEVTDVSPQEF